MKIKARKRIFAEIKQRKDARKKLEIYVEKAKKPS